MSESNPQANRQIARAAGTVMLAFLFSQLTGLAAKIVIWAAFPAGFDLDAFYVANQPSESLLTIMAGGILVSSFIPVFVKYLVKEDRPSAWRLASSTANLILILMTSLAAMEAIFARPIVQYLLGSGFTPEKQSLTIDLLRIQAISIIFFGLSGLLVGILNSHQKFLFSALSPAMYNLGQIFGILFLTPSLGIYGLAWGVVLGSAFSLLIQIPALLRLKGTYTPTFGLHNSSVGEVFRLMAPRMFGAAAVQLMVLVNTLLASHMDPGSVSSLRLGFSLMMIAWAVIAQSIATAAMPTFSTQFAQGKTDELRRTLSATLRGILLLTIPATLGLILLRIPIITLAFQRQEFTAETTRMVAWALLWYTVGLVFHAALEVLVRAYYAMHDTWTPVLIGAAAMLLSIGLSFVFSSLFTRLGWMPLGGLALAVSLSTGLEVGSLFLFMRKRLNGIEGIHLLKGLVCAVLGTLGMSGALMLWVDASTGRGAALTTLVGITLGGSVYVLVLVLLRVQEVSQVILALRRRLFR